MAAVGARGGRRAGYRRRRPLPALLVLACLVVAAGFLWTRVFDSVQDIEAATTCNPPTPPTAAPAAGEEPTEQVPLGEMLARDALDSTGPIPPQDVQVRVLNGNGESRQATLVSDELSSLGFAEGGADNDPVYVNYDLKCHGQIRFGGAGVSAARTLSLIAPCAQLVRDDRSDATVDFALGSKFDDIKTTSAAKQVLQELENWVPQRDQQGGANQEVTPPKIDEELLTKARDVHC
ncbi:LytR cell envelope-related transcriptional attenuator [Saccharopolyspora kobensis]|uniref:LytR cell envelope-related transcriptional attenuator n=1 Tax=Saccharopolyspora kobensis TaxID=146035 RepID=A0A1H6DRH9_9PSEU|nr:envelope integrity protein Cei [Saccharopolyspora kobensis]SEG87326.1 LytR cell envelope-related transcriptional attenuator [Saccharopolyspora kobensis]SFE06940.1 LytR cell envelope-related transcriptional attenuator [Saccharopolyspora kobensis]